MVPAHFAVEKSAFTNAEHPLTQWILSMSVNTPIFIRHYRKVLRWRDSTSPMRTVSCIQGVTHLYFSGSTSRVLYGQAGSSLCQDYAI